VITYEVYADRPGGGARCRVYSFKAYDDVAAETFVMERLTDRTIELWCHSRRVARFEGKSCHEAVNE
jgi:hypothetical protein